MKFSNPYLMMLIVISLNAASVAAQTVPLENLTQDQFKSVIGDFSSGFLHTAINGAGSLGHLWGFEVGLVGSDTSTPHLQTAAKQANSGGVDASHVPTGAILARLSLPVGLTGEASFLPRVGPTSFNASDYALAAKWTPTEVFGNLPLDLALKASYTYANADFSGTVNSNPVAYDFKDKIFAVEALVSKNLYIVEPYLAFGFASAHGELNGSGTTDLFATSYTASSAASETQTGTVFRAGLEIKLFFARLGFEYANAFSSSRLSGKLSVAF